jgi:hypothetical protein
VHLHLAHSGDVHLTFNSIGINVCIYEYLHDNCLTGPRILVMSALWTRLASTESLCHSEVEKNLPKANLNEVNINGKYRPDSSQYETHFGRYDWGKVEGKWGDMDGFYGVDPATHCGYQARSGY